MGRDCGDVCSVRESRTITLKVRRRASAGHSRVQRGESGLQRRSVRESGTITLKVRRRASAGHSRVQGGESGLRRRSARESGTITLKEARHRRRLCPVGPHIQQRLLIAPPFIVGYV